MFWERGIFRLVRKWLVAGRSRLFKITTINWVSFHRRNKDNCYILVLLAWLIEWLSIIECLFVEFSRYSFFLPIKIPTIFVFILIYWSFVQGLSFWKRSQSGHLNKGERRLWHKTIAIFWVAEFIIVAALVMVYYWVACGPPTSLGRRLIVPRKGLEIEFIIYTYIIFIAFITKFTSRWCLWRFHRFTGFIVVICFSCLLYRDACTLLIQDFFPRSNDFRWENMRLAFLVFSFSPEQWLTCTPDEIPEYDWFLDLKAKFEARIVPAGTAVFLVEYEQISPFADFQPYPPLPIFSLILDSFFNELFGWNNAIFHAVHGGNYFCPHRTGFITGRLALWQLLILLRMWHYSIMLLWWYSFARKLRARQKIAYSTLAVCYFNIHYCYLLSLMIHTTYYAVYFEMWLKFWPDSFIVYQSMLWVLRNLWSLFCF